MRRLLYFLVIVLVVALVVLLGYYFGYRRGGPEITPGAPAAGGLPATPAQKFPGAPLSQGVQPETVPSSQPTLLPAQAFGRASESLVVDYVVRADGSILLVQPDGKIVALSPQGQATIVSATLVPLLVDASFSPFGTKLVALTGSYRSPRLQLFDLATKKWEGLEGSLSSPAWSPTLPRLAYLRIEGGLTAVEVLDLSTSTRGVREVLRLNAADLSLSWYAPETFTLAPRGSAFAQGTLFLLALQGGALTPVLFDHAGLEAVWNVSGTVGLVLESNRNARGGLLRLVNREGETIRLLAFLTLPSKCAFGEAAARGSPLGSAQKASAPATTPVLYCAVPRNREALEGSPLPDAYYARAFMTADNFYEINLETGEAAAIFEDAGRIVDAVNLAPVQGRLYFVNRYDQKLYGIALPR